MKLIDGEKMVEDLRRYKHEVVSVDGLEGVISLMPSVEPEKVCIANITLSEEQLREAAEKVKRQKVQVLPSAQPTNIQEDIQDIIEYLDTVLHPIVSPEHWNVYSELHDMISALSSAQPEQRWILCEQHMPEEREWIGTKRFGTTMSDEVFVTFESPDGVRFVEHLCFQNGKLSGYDQQMIDAFHKGAVPIAWKPLPEPYRDMGNKEEMKE